MKLPRFLVVLMGIALLVAAIGCSAINPAEVAPTPNIDATVEARVTQERSADATVVANLKQEIAAQPTLKPQVIIKEVPVEVIKEVSAVTTPVPTLTPVPTATFAWVPTAMPTRNYLEVPSAATPLPTATPVPTATPAPTATPVPTATPKPPPTAEVVGSIIGATSFWDGRSPKEREIENFVLFRISYPGPGFYTFRLTFHVFDKAGYKTGHSVINPIGRPSAGAMQGGTDYFHELHSRIGEAEYNEFKPFSYLPIITDFSPWPGSGWDIVDPQDNERLISGFSIGSSRIAESSG